MSAAIVYWSQTGNTEAMANVLAEACGGEVIEWDGLSASQVADFDAFASVVLSWASECEGET